MTESRGRSSLQPKLVRTGLSGISHLLLALAAAAAAEQDPPRAQTNLPAFTPLSPAAEEKRACTKNLRTIHIALDKFRSDQHDLPDWLSDLVPQYLPDPSVLICPVCRRTGATEAPPLADPKLPCSYVFEFSLAPLGAAAPNAPDRTRRDWKRRQMGLLGAQVPLVRCRHHTPALNLAFDGKVYESPEQWELLFTNRVDAAELTAARLFADESQPPKKAPAKGPARRFPARDARAGKELLDLTRFYNAQLNLPGSGARSNALAALPRGLQAFNGVEFDVRGMIRLRNRTSSTNFPPVVKGIPLKQKCQKVHFLHAATAGPGEAGTQIGTYVINFAANKWRLEIPIRYGHEVRSLQPMPDEPQPPKELVVAWRGPGRNKAGGPRLFLTTWTNVAPGLEIESIDFVSSMAGPSPLLIAITVE